MAPEPTLSQQPGTMLLSTCSFCAAPLHAWNTKDCERCETRYCDALCQRQHWRAKDGAHEKLCQKIERGGGAEQHHAKRRCAIADAIAVRSCVADTAGEICYICRTDGKKEGLVRGCACRGTMGAAHLSCLAQQARLANENDPAHTGPLEDYSSRWGRWHTCGLCEQSYHGVVMHALGWACWKTYVGRPDGDSGVMSRMSALRYLGIGLSAGGHHADAVSVQEAELSTLRRIGSPEECILVTQGNLAIAYERNGRPEDCLRTWQDIYSRCLEFFGEEHEQSILGALNYASTLNDLERFAEARSLFGKVIPVARRVLGDSHDITLRMRSNYARALYVDPGATLDHLREAVTTLEETDLTARRVLGGAHPVTMGIESDLRNTRAALGAREESDVSGAMAAMAPPSAQH